MDLPVFVDIRYAVVDGNQAVRPEIGRRRDRLLPASLRLGQKRTPIDTVSGPLFESGGAARPPYPGEPT